MHLFDVFLVNGYVTGRSGQCFARLEGAGPHFFQLLLEHLLELIPVKVAGRADHKVTGNILAIEKRKNIIALH